MKITEKIHKLRIQYERETDDLRRAYRESMTVLKRELERARAIDYVRPYRDKYISFAEAMEGFYQKILRAERNIHGLDFYTDRYLPTASPRSFGTKNVEEMFEEVAAACGTVAEDLERNHTPEEYGKLLRIFCDLLVTMRHIVRNADALLSKSGIPSRAREDAVGAAEEKIERTEADFERRLQRENLSCYGEMTALAAELEEMYRNTSAELLGKMTPDYDERYRYLIGFHVEKPSEEDARFCEEELGVGREKIGREPIYLDLRTPITNLIINAPKAFLSGPDCAELVRNIYFSFASRLNKSMLRFGYIECTDRRGVVRSIYTDINAKGLKQKLGGDGEFCYESVKVDRGDKVAYCLNGIKDDCRDVVDKYENLIEYNCATERDKQPLKMVAVNLYPEGFVESGITKPSYDMLQLIMEEFYDSGCIMIVCQDTDHPALQQPGVRLDGERHHALEITLDASRYAAWKASGKPLSACEFMLDGRPAVLDITVPDFDSEQYYTELKQFYATKKVYALREVFRKSDELGKRRSAFDDGVIEIPLGLKSGEEYSMRYPLSKAAHTLIYGGSGSGKSSFLHTFILSLCYHYSAEEVQIYLADFKGVEFGFYARHKLPHIKYFLMKNGVSEVRDTFEMIERIRLSRNEIIERAGCGGDIIGYNKMAKSCTDGSMKKMPMIFFIIDEYQVIREITKASIREMDDIQAKINTIFSQARSSGIALFLCGQDIRDMSNLPTENIKNMVLLGKQDNNDIYIRKHFLADDDSLDVGAVKDFLSVEQDGRCLIKLEEERIGDKVHAAYAGKSDEKKSAYVDAILSLPRAENKKKLSMILGGCEDPFPVSDDERYHDELMQEGNTSFHLSIGIGSTLGLPSNLDFASEDLTYGWMIHCANSERMFHITRNAVFSFLYKTAAVGYDYSELELSRRVLYCGDPYSYNHALGKDYFRASIPAAVASHVRMLNVDTEAYEIYGQIVELNEELQRRHSDMSAKGVRFSKTQDYPPYLLVIQSPEFLNEGHIERVLRKHDETVAEDAQDQTPQESTVDEGTMQTVKAMGLNPLFAKRILSQKQQSSQKPKRKLRLTQEGVTEAFVNLFERGNCYGIFVLLASAKQESVKNIFPRGDYSEEKYAAHTVCGTYDEYTGNVQVSRSNESVMLCYTGMEGIKTRLYDYAPDSQQEWWDELAARMKGE